MNVTPEIQRLLAPGETVQWIGRAHARVARTTLGSGLLLIVGLLVVAGLLLLLTPGWQMGVMAILTAVIGAPILGVYELAAHRRTRYVVTERRTFLQRGVVTREVEIVDHDQVTDAAIHIGWFDRALALGTGSIRLRTAADLHPLHPHAWAPDARRTLKHVPDALGVQGRILALRESRRRPPPPPPPARPTAAPRTIGPSTRRSAAKRPAPPRRRGDVR